jgi:hypothetical protein
MYRTEIKLQAIALTDEETALVTRALSLATHRHDMFNAVERDLAEAIVMELGGKVDA